MKYIFKFCFQIFNLSFFTNSVSTGWKNLKGKSCVRYKDTLGSVQDGSDSICDIRDVVQAFEVTLLLNRVQHFARGRRGHELVAGRVLLCPDAEVIGLRQELLERLQRPRQGRGR